MAIYSIRDLEKLTGVKAHTIRVWELRYRLVQPARTGTNIRFYTDENLRHLFNISLLNRHGYKISKLAKLPPEELAMKVSEITEKSTDTNAQTDKLTLCMLSMDEQQFEQIFSAYCWDFGFERTMLDLIYPFLEKLKVLWLTSKVSPAHEKFVGNLIRRKLMCAIDKEPNTPARDAGTFLLFTPESETQELTLLFVHYLLRNRQQKSVYLGTNTNLDDVRDACLSFSPDYIYTILPEPVSRQTIQSYADFAAEPALDANLLLTSIPLFNYSGPFPSNVKVFNGLHDTIQFLDDLKIKQRCAK